MTSNKTYPLTFIPLMTFDIEKLHVSPPRSNTFNDVTTVKSKFLYENDEGELSIPYFEAPKQRTSFWEVFPMQESKQDAQDKTLSGYQLSYPVCSNLTLEDPTEEEVYYKDMLNSIAQKVRESMVDFVELKDKDEEYVLPKQTLISYNGSKNDEWLKPMYSYPKKDADKKGGKKIIDKDRPQRTYIKLLTTGKGDTLKVLTKIFGPGDEALHPSSLVTKQCEIEPVFKLDSVFYGAHGETGCGASIQIKLDQCNYYPVESSSTPKYLKSNTCTERLSDMFPEKSLTKKDIDDIALKGNFENKNDAEEKLDQEIERSKKNRHETSKTDDKKKHRSPKDDGKRRRHRRDKD